MLGLLLNIEEDLYNFRYFTLIIENQYYRCIQTSWFNQRYIINYLFSLNITSFKVETLMYPKS